MTTRRQDSIDLLRALAIVLVLAFHYTTAFEPSYLRYPGAVGYVPTGLLGVELFFAVSGYCIYATIEKSCDVIAFWARRISRLYPAFAASALLTFAIVAWFGLPERQVNVWTLAGNLLWLNFFLPVHHVDGAYWSLAVELKFYLWFGALYFLLRRVHPLAWWSAFVLLGAGISALGSQGAYLSKVVFIAPYAPFFLLGMIARDFTRLSWFQCAMLALVFAAGIAAREGVHVIRLHPTIVTGLGFYGVVAMLTIAVMRWERLRIPFVLRWLALISYPLYLVHQNIGLVVIRESAVLLPDAYLRIALAAAAAVLLAWTISASVEYRYRDRITFFIESVWSLLVSRMRGWLGARAQRKIEADSPVDSSR